MVRSLPSRPVSLAAALFVSWIFVGCVATPKITGDSPDVAILREYQTYAWVSSPLPAETQGVPVLDAALIEDVQAAADYELGRRGFVRVEQEVDASVALSAHLTVVTETVYDDPFFATYHAMQKEIGTLQIEFLDIAQRNRIWSSSLERRLRDSATGIGINSTKFVDTGESQDWAVEETTRRILNPVPFLRVRQAYEAPRRAI